MSLEWCGFDPPKEMRRGSTGLADSTARRACHFVWGPRRRKSSGHMFHNVPHEEWPNLRGVSADLRKVTVLNVHLAPGSVFRVGAAGQVAIVHGIGSDAASIAEHACRHIEVESLIGDLDERCDVLRIVAGHSAAD